MSSFELKPQGQLTMDSTVDDIVFTCARDEIPVLLKGRVDLCVWQTTYDKVLEIYATAFEAAEPARQQMKKAMFCPCLLVCLVFRMREMMQATRITQEAWAQLVQEQAGIYRKYGVHVTLAKELYSAGVGSDRHMRNETVGLKFDIAADTTASSSASPPSASTTSGNGDMTSKLSDLANLHRQGALTDEEYAQAKQRVLSGNN